MTDILYFEDKLGITTNYESLFRSIMHSVRLDPAGLRKFSLYRGYPHVNWLVPYANRKALTWNPERVHQIKEIVESVIRQVNPKLVICADPAALSVLGVPADYATLDVLRGGVYDFAGRKFLVTIPISAWHRQVKEKDLMIVNKGFTDKEEFNDYYLGVEGTSSSDSDDIPASGDDVDGDDSVGGGAEDEGDDTPVFYEPLIVPYGRFVITADLKKARRLLAGAGKQ